MHIHARACFLLASGLLVSTNLPAQSSFSDFFGAALRTISAPPRAESLVVRCSADLRPADTPLGVRGTLSLVGPSDGAAWLALITPKKPRAVAREISTTPRFDPLPTARPYRDGSLDWGWIWDRNEDGRVDYIAYLQNAHPWLPLPLPDSFPTIERKADGSFSITMATLSAMLDNARMIFRHYADDDFDGSVDGFVVEEFDPDRPMFVRGFVAAQSGGHDGHVTTAWAFREDITDTTAALPATGEGFQTPSIGDRRPSRESADARLAYGTKLLTAINVAAARCRSTVAVRTGATTR